MKNINRKTLIFIPDISGFTNFVNRTEIEHSRHIITELLEIIINSDKCKMIVSEVEGDAVLFYKQNDLDLHELIEQCGTTFLNFHNHLQRYESERICRCGACETASDLSLKFIVHFGEAGIIKIKNHEKLHGTDVILAHKLLKNSINVSEYILMSGEIDRNTLSELSSKYSWVQLHDGEDQLDDLGNVNYKYIPLNQLNKEIAPQHNLTFPDLGSRKIILESTIKAPVDVVYEYYTDFDKRIEWNEAIRKIILQDGKLSRSGSIHSCLVGKNELDIESIGRIEDDESIVYGERLNEFKGLRDIINIFTFEKKGNETILKVELDFKVKSWFGRLIKPFINKMFRKQTEQALAKLKKVSESVSK